MLWREYYYEVPDHELVYLFNDTDQAITDVDDIYDIEESPVISTSTAIASLEIVTCLSFTTGQCRIITSLQNIEKFVEVRKTSSMRQSNIFY